MYGPKKKQCQSKYLHIYSHGHHAGITDGKKLQNICTGHFMITYIKRSVTKIWQLIQKLHGRKKTCRHDGSMASLHRMK
jgi:hypothetical protein